MNTTLSSKTQSEEDLYPSGDGEPMAESELHAGEMVYAHHSLEIWLENRPDAHISTDSFLYYRQGDPSAVVSPDHYVVFGLDKRLRDSFQVWKEGGKLPSFVLEITSKSTRRIDYPAKTTRTKSPTRKNKFEIYEQTLKVAEYFLFDPTGDYLKPRLQGFRLEMGRYVPILPEPQPLPHLPAEDQPGYWLYSAQLGLALAHEDIHLRFYDPVSGGLLLRARDMAHATALAESRAAMETQRADQEAQRADMEVRARAQMEAELARLRAEVEELRRRNNGGNA
jgi:Uma2 family endonuclease